MGDINNSAINRLDPFLVMYHGALTTGRGIEELINVVAINPNIKGVVLGNGSPQYVSHLHQLVDEKKAGSRILFHPAVPMDELWKYVSAVDLSLMMIQGKAKSYYYSLPNKFFESIQALTPIVASDFPEMKRIIDKYEIGLTCNPENIESINSCIEKMRTDKEFYTKCKNNLVTAKNDLCWEKEKEKLKDAFKRYIK